MPGTGLTPCQAPLSQAGTLLEMCVSALACWGGASARRVPSTAACCLWGSGGPERCSGHLRTHSCMHTGRTGVCLLFFIYTNFQDQVKWEEMMLV